MKLTKKVSKVTWKRCLTAMLSFCLCLTCIPITASAKDEQEAKEVKTEQKVSSRAAMARSYAPEYASEEDTEAIETAPSLTLEEAHSVSINSVGGKQWFTFTPDETKTYYFYSLNSSQDEEGLDPYGALYKKDVSGKYVCIDQDDDHYYNDWTSLGGLDFCIDIKLYTGTTYYLCASLHEDSLTGTYYIKVSDTDPTALTEEMIGTPDQITAIDTFYNVSLNSSDGRKWFTFTPSESGIYYFYSESTIDTYGSLYKQVEDVYTYLDSNDNNSYDDVVHSVSDNPYDFCMVDYLEAGVIYCLGTRLSGESDNQAFTVKVSKNNPYAITNAIVGNPESIRLNETKNVSIEAAGATKWFTFTPSETGTYYFYSKGEEDSVAGFYTFNSDNGTYNQVAWNDDSDENLNFNLPMDLEANQIYYLAASLLSSYDTGSFTVGLSTNPNAYKEDSQPTPTPEPVKPAPSATTQIKAPTKPAQPTGIPTTGISVAKKSIALKKGGKIKLSTILNPLNSTDSITFSSSKPKVAQVSQNGTVKAKKPGKAKITIRTSSGKTVVVTVNVKKNAVKTKKVSMKKKLTVQNGTVRFLSYKVNPKQSTDKMKWKSSKKGVVSVDSNGKITAKKKGKAVITLSIGNKKASCKITVK